jgi:hypothetical protein
MALVPDHRHNARALSEKGLLQALLALNLALLVTFASYLVLSLEEESAQPVRAPGPGTLPKTAPAGPTPKADPHVLEIAFGRTSLRNPDTPVRTFTFRDIESPDYSMYLHTLKQAGCPEEHLRHIVLADVRELFAQKCLQEAIRHDFEWWRAEPEPVVASLLREKGRELAEQQQQLARKLLGASQEPDPATAFWSHVPLTGALLGALSEDLHAKVQAICSQWTGMATADPAGRPPESLNPVTAARGREQFRAQLAEVLSTKQLEEFLIRYSQHAVALREELRPIKPTPDEFRSVFGATEPLDRELQIEFGNAGALADAQRERFLRLRNEALRQALAANRYAAYLLARNERR